jgi:nitrile hydratase accessory protein
MAVDRRIANLDGESGLPRKNGELVFQAPWEGRAFGMAVILNDKGAYDWEEFRARLAENIAGGEPDYYHSWLEALQKLLVDRGVLKPEEIAARAAEYEALERDPVF